ncbi:SDR family NAD(P)-dependent oxidoreductase [Chitinophaga pinensis]|uniref:Short-chain dehydrogenase/reductase SDR n=1 Tax=Chitinophaga pinensis (strain ATCC 43595 / DSM 2588 / LMG 13176 / NBRC 15968 / NCIMB 11800 / UQM 2034) TaxID=485918 RepID=A0A979GZL7_CHIPD|nr:SDR family oxidoreductase [Chitinophaga pinensis]ACU64099.1 short-chain dehydrogenase/reductase SDR [Chitinophaga pinensis DSM 2588]
MELQLKGKTAFISGSTQGIGFAVAQQLLEEGAHVIINGRTKTRVDEAVRKLLSGAPEGNVSGVAADFGKEQDVRQLLETLPDVDILVNNVGVFALKDFGGITDSEWQSVFDVNVMSGVRLSRALLPAMIAKKWGRILFISSESGVNVPANMIHYGMTKTAMLSLSNGLSKLTRGTAVTVNTILGGPTYSDGVAGAVKQIAQASNTGEEEMKTAILQNTNPHSLLQRFIAPEEIAGIAAYLCSPLSAAINGAAIRADGGVLNTIL